VKTRKKLSVIIATIFGFSNLIVFASNIIFSPDTGNLLMYCPQQINIEIQNPDTTLSTIDMVLTYSGTQIEDTNFSIYDVVDYSTPFVNKYDNSFGFDSRLFSASRLLWRFWNQDWINKSVWTFLFKNKNLQRSVDLWFYALPNNTAWDTNLSYGWEDYLDVPAGVWLANYSFITGTCVPDTKKPETPNSYKNVVNNSYRVSSGIDINFRIIDQNWSSADFRYPSNDFSLSNYSIAPAYIDNQYWVNSGTIKVIIDGNSYSDEFTLNWVNNFSSIVATGITRHRKDKWYDIVLDPLHDFRVEEWITITIQWYDNTHISKQNSYFQTETFRFNQAKSPEVVWSSFAWRQPNRNDLIDPELEEIKFRVQDDRAGVDSWSLVIEVRTWTSTFPNGWVIKTYSNNEFTKSGVTLTFASNWLPWSNSITHSYNYDITLTWFWILPENTYIRVMVGWVDMGYIPQHFNPYSFHFKTRQSCSSLQCGAGVNIFTGDIVNSTIYLSTGLTISWGLNPMISGEYLYCFGPEYLSVDLYTGGTEISYWNMTGWNLLFDNFSWWNLQIEVVWWIAELVGNTLYVTKSGPSCGNRVVEVGETCDDGNNINWDGCNASCQLEYSGGGWGWWWWGWWWWWWGWWLSKDDCQLPESNLPGANREWIDYSSSYYDRTCLWNQEIDDNNDIPVIFAPVCELGTDYEDELVSSYKYACELGLIDDGVYDVDYMKSAITRKELAQMVVEYSAKILMKYPDKNKLCSFDDIYYEDQKTKDYIVSSCQLNILWIDSKENSKKSFNPNWFVTEAQFVTVFSRLLRWSKYNIDAEDYYRDHASALLKEYIIDDFDPTRIQTRTYIMEMMQKTDRSIIAHVHKYQPFLDTQNLCSVSPYWEEIEEAYMYACERGITTKPTIDKAKMYGTMYRNDLAKMVSAYAMVELKKVPDRTRECDFDDIENQSAELRYYIITACQLGLMWLDYKWDPATLFRPTNEVTRAQFLTVFSRMIRWWRYNWDFQCYYCPHAKALKTNGVVKDIEDPDWRLELRWYVMLMMYRAKEIVARAFGE